MELVADRFVVTKEDTVIDLSSGEQVVLVISSAGGVTEHTRWALRCDRFFKLRHPTIARLVDYGRLGETRRFEAWRCGPAWRGSELPAKEARQVATTFLGACGLTDLSAPQEAVRCLDAQAVVLPDASCGFETEAATERETIVPLSSCAVSLIGRREVAALAGALGEIGFSEQHLMALSGPEGSGVRTAVQELARAARISGLIPVSPSALSARVVHLLAGRSLFLICGEPTLWRWRGLVECSLRTPKPHVVLFAGRTEVPHVQGLALGRLSEESLIRAVQPRCFDRAATRRLERAARRSDGLPGRFIRLVWGLRSSLWTMPKAEGRSRAAEQLSVYGEVTAPTAASAPIGEPRLSWPAPGELAALRRRMDAGVQQLERGRRASGERALRQAVGGLARRQDWSHAAQGSSFLAAALLRRGRPHEAQTILAAAKEYGMKAGQDGPLLTIAVLSGLAWTDLARLDEAEAVLQTAVTAARDRMEPHVVASSRLALARCLFWRGRFHEADRELSAIDGRPLPDEMKLRVAIASSRVAIGRRDFCQAVSKASAALESARQLNAPSMIAHAACASAFVHLSVGDRLAVSHDLAICIQAARAAHDPLRALRARLLEAESARRGGQEGAANALLSRIRKFSSASIPITVGARCALLADLLCAASSPIDVVKRHVAATGLGALALFAPVRLDESDNRIHSAVDDVLEILRCCQVADDESCVLEEVCTRLRNRLKASAVAFFGPERQPGPLASNGHRIEIGIAKRVIATADTIAPHLHEDRVEGGSPVRYGGEMIGALVGRWPLGVSHDPTRASMMLTMAATAAGPAVAGVLARLARASEQTVDGLLGVSAEMAEIRRAVERAAAAPFAVLIEGESGSGKELVARALHRRSPRRLRPFCTINCAALPDDLIEAELFGHARGAFTGAVAERPGVFEEAHTGTLFLDEVGELSPRAQAKVLRVVQESELRRVGENIARRVDVRIVAATNRDLRHEVAASRFRLDLLYRLDVIRIVVPPLRNRRDDIAVLVERFWREAVERVGSRATLSAATIAALARYDWPGNVRELQNVLASLAVRSPKRGVVPPTALPPGFAVATTIGSWRLDAARRTFEERFVRAALVRSAGQRGRAAEELGLTRQGFTKLMTRLGISEG